MKFDVLTLFPEMIELLASYSILGKSIAAGRIEVNAINIRDFSTDKHHRVDDVIYGGGPGMLMTPQPLHDAIMSVQKEESLVVYLSPQGKKLKQSIVNELSHHKHIILVCGHYEGIDQRIIDQYIDMELSIGDYVLTGGELPAMVVIDALSRFVDGVLGNEESAICDSHYDGLLKYATYTRPRDFQGHVVPEVLLSGNHQKIEDWRKESALENTKSKRPDLLQDTIEQND